MSRASALPEAERAELAAILRAHAERYPRMQPSDAVKLLYQNEFGGGHLIADPAASLARLQTEYAATERGSGVPLFEPIGNGIVRVQLAALDPARYPLASLNRDFVRSAALHTGEQAHFLGKLALLQELLPELPLAFSVGELLAYLNAYARAGYPAVSHSAAYREAYRPAYRVVLHSVLGV